MKYTYLAETDTRGICIDERCAQLERAINQLELINKMSINPVENLKKVKPYKALKTRNLN